MKKTRQRQFLALEKQFLVVVRHLVGQQYRISWSCWTSYVKNKTHLRHSITGKNIVAVTKNVEENQFLCNWASFKLESTGICLYRTEPRLLSIRLRYVPRKQRNHWSFIRKVFEPCSLSIRWSPRSFDLTPYLHEVSFRATWKRRSTPKIQRRFKTSKIELVRLTNAGL